MKQRINLKFGRIPVLWFVFLCTWPVFILLPAEVVSQTQVANYFSITDGLVSPNVKHIHQDTYSIFWIATENGLQKYDGEHFVNYRNEPGDPHCLAAMKKNRYIIK